MRKWMAAWLVLLAGCSAHETVGDATPPAAQVVINDTTYDAVLGTYCWANTCVDKAGPVELLADVAPIAVQGGEQVHVVIDGDVQPNEVHVAQIVGEVTREVALNDGQLIVPYEEGIYYYSYGAWWLDEEDAQVSKGDAFYAFSLQVGQ